MTVTANREAPVAATHPLDRLTADEIRAARAILVQAGLLGTDVRVPLLTLQEPAKQDVLAHRDGDPVDRRARAVLLDVATGRAHIAAVSMSRWEVDAVVEVDPLTEGQPPIMEEEFVAVGEIVKADEGWCAALRRRGVTDLSQVAVCPLSAGAFDIPGEAGRRMLRALAFRQDYETDSPWAHPIDGVVAYVDLTSRRVVELLDDEDLPIPSEHGNFADVPARSTLAPISITQDAVSWTVEGDVVEWEGWRLRVGFDAREGLTLHQVSIQGRPVIYRASVAEMVVPYGDPSPVRFWQNYFDTGEYSLGQMVRSLREGCDCLGEIRYFDAVLPTADLEPRQVRQAICLHEEDASVLWRHYDLFTDVEEVRRQRRLVISFWATIGNYDYGFYWYLYLDGTIEFEVKATGALFTSADPDRRWAPEVAPGLGAPVHQHLFCVRLDMTVDGIDNTVDEVDVRPAPLGPDNLYGSAFGAVATRLTRESEAGRLADTAAGRTWRIASSDRHNNLGQPTAYVLRPQPGPTLLADPSSSIARRAAFAARHLWVTRYDPDERYPAGEFPNQHPGGAGLPTWTKQDRTLDGEDLVVWHTVGSTHVPRPEDWPIMPVDRSGFLLRPHGFFDRNPTLDVPPAPGAHCSTAAE